MLLAAALAVFVIIPCLNADPVPLGRNMDFEDPVDYTPAGIGGGGGDLFTWRSDGTAFMNQGPVIAGAETIKPYHGSMMMQFTYDIDPRCSNCDMAQDVDLKPYTNSIAASNVTFHFDFRYNRIAEVMPAPLPPVVQTMIFYKIIFMNTNDDVVANFGPEPDAGAPLADNDPVTWEQAALNGPVPPDAVKAELRISWHCNVLCEGNGHLYGHFADDAHFALDIAPAKPVIPQTGFVFELK